MPAQQQILDEEFERVGETALDDRSRVSLTKAVEMLRERFGADLSTVRFVISRNRAGQVLLSPQTVVPLHEAWLLRNPAALASVQRGLDEAARGELHDLGSFEQYADDEID